MPNYFERAEQMTTALLLDPSVAGVAATYARDNSSTGSVSLNVTPRGWSQASGDEYGLPTTPPVHDFVLAPSALGSLWPPKIGDKLTACGRTYFVAAQDNGAAYAPLTRYGAALAEIRATEEAAS